ncbi:MAG: dTMP kinase [Bdellovibrionales bacterium]
MPFLAFEGLDGSGKSTLINGLKSEFEQRKIAFVITREPGGTILGDEIRQMLLRVKGEAPVPRSEALLYQAGRAQHVENLIRPALAEKKWVLSDRFAASSVAFQAGGRAISREQIDWLNDFSTGGLSPDLYVLLDLTVEESLKRLSRRGEETDRFEREAKEFHEKVRHEYLQMAKANPERWLVLLASEPPKILQAKLLQALKDKKWLA